MESNFLGKVIRKLENIKDKKITELQVKKIKKIGKGSVFEKGLIVIGGSKIEIGDNFYFGLNGRLEAWQKYDQFIYNPKIIIGNNVKINSNCHIGSINKIVIGDNVLIGSEVFITDHSHGTTSKEELNIIPNERKLYSKGKVIIEDNCWIGEKAIILPNVHIGKGTIIGAGAIVTHDIPPYVVAVGNPAKVVKNLD